MSLYSEINIYIYRLPCIVISSHYGYHFFKHLSISIVKMGTLQNVHHFNIYFILKHISNSMFRIGTVQIVHHFWQYFLETRIYKPKLIYILTKQFSFKFKLFFFQLMGSDIHVSHCVIKCSTANETTYVQYLQCDRK